MYKYCIKRMLDIIFALILLILTFVPMLIIAICIKLDDRGPIIYKSKRIGKNCKPFYMYKFRTMKANRKELQSNVKYEEMITKVGKIIKKTSLDELPQIFNVLKGEMSFIGPRPWIPQYYQYFTQKQKARTKVLPGISGLAQVKGRNGINVFKKIEYDLFYVKNLSFCLDVKLVLFTIGVVINKKNSEITEEGIKKEIEQLKSKKISQKKLK